MDGYLYTQSYCAAETILAQATEEDRDTAIEAVQSAFETFELTDEQRTTVAEAVAILGYPGITVGALSIIIKTAVEKQRFIEKEQRGTING